MTLDDEPDATMLANLRSALDHQPELGREALRLMIETNAHAVEIYAGGVAMCEAAAETELDPSYAEERREHLAMLVGFRDRHRRILDELERERERRA